MIANNILVAVYNCFYVFIIMIAIRCLLSWIPGISNRLPIIRVFIDAVDLYLDLFRKFIPPIGFIDISPIVASIVLIVIQNIVLYLLAFMFNMLGLLG